MQKEDLVERPAGSPRLGGAGQCDSVGKVSGGKRSWVCHHSALDKPLNLHQLSLLLCKMEIVTALTSQGPWRGLHEIMDMELSQLHL